MPAICRRADRAVARPRKRSGFRQHTSRRRARGGSRRGIGGGRGAGIGAASGAIVGTGVGAANAQSAAGYLQQQYNAYYAQWMASRRYPPPAYGSPAPAYAPAPGYGPQPSYPPPGVSSNAGSRDLNRQELNRLYGPPPYPPR